MGEEHKLTDLRKEVVWRMTCERSEFVANVAKFEQLLNISVHILPNIFPILNTTCNMHTNFPNSLLEMF